jgi:hypothetical protein
MEGGLYMIRKGVVFLFFAVGLLVLSSCMSGMSQMTSSFESVSSSEMPYRGIIIGSYWQEWPCFSKREFVEPNILFIGIHQYDGPMMTHYYRFEIHVFHQRDSSLYVETFKGVQLPHFLFGFSRFYDLNSRTNLRKFTGDIQGFVLKRAGTENIYDILLLKVNGTALYATQTGFEDRVFSGLLRHRHYIELLQFNGTRTPFFLSGTGKFYYYYSVPYGLHPWEDPQS